MDEPTGPLRSEARLRESERRLRAVLEQGPLAIAVTGAKGEIVFRNAEFDRLWGRPAHDTTANTYSAVYEGYHLDGRPVTSEEWPGARALLKGDAVDGEVLEIVHQSGRRIACSFNAGPIRDEAGRITGAVVMFRDVTEERRMQAALERQNEERYRAIVETATDYAIFTTDAEGRIETWAKGAEMVFGWSAAEAVGQPVEMTYTPEDRAEGVPAKERQEAKDKGYAPNVRWHLRKDGSRIFIDGNARPLTGSDGAVIGFVKVGQDVTERRRAEEQLQLATEAAALGIFDVDLTTGAIEWDARLRELWGVGPNEAITDETFLAGVHPEDHAQLQAVLAKAFDAGGDRLYAAEYRLRPRKDGRERWIAATGRVHFDGQRPVRLVGTVQDISERKLTEAAVRASEARLRGVLGGMGEAFALLDRDFRILTFNEAALRLETRPIEEIVGRSHWEVYPGSEDSEIGRLYKRALAEGQPVSLEHRYTWEDGTARWLEMRAYPVPEGLAVFWRDVTERKEAETELRESEARFRLMADAVPQIVWVTDADGRTEFFNKQWSDYTGVPYEPTTAAEVAANHVHPDDGAATIAAFDKARRTGTTFLVEHRIRSASGRYRWFLVRAEPHRDPETGEIVRWVGASVDIHDRRQAEEALRASEARFQAVANSIDQMVWSTRPDGFHDYYNQRWYDYTGVPEGSTDGERWNDVFHPDDQERAWSAWRHSLETGEPYHIEYRLRHRSGRYRWVLGRAQPVRDDRGRISRWFGTCTDIQDIVEAREVLARSREELEELVEERTAERNQLWTLSQDMLARADYSGMMSAVSPAWTRVLGWSEAELLARPYASFMHAEDMGPTLEALARMGETGEPTRFENRIATREGDWKPIEWTVAPEPEGPNFIAVGRDLSEVKAQEDEIRQAQEALRQSQKMEAMGQLTGGVAHDFNNLLTPIIGSLDRLLKRGVGSERERRLMDGALQSAERAKVLVQRLLAFARRQPLQPAPVDVKHLVSGMADLIVSTTGPRIDVRVEMPEDLPPALADANQLEMALLNLAVNARDAMPEGGTLTISAARESVRRPHPARLRHGHYMRLSVKDTGTGMDQATLARAVEPFFSTKGIGKGTGLGLSMVHGLAEQLGGGLTITSRPGQGTTVDLWLPISAVGAEEDERAAHTVTAPKAQGTALLVDDEDLVRMSTADMLMDLGYEVVEAQSADEALRMVGEGLHPDLVVTDHLMPGLSGVDLARDLRSRWPDLPVLIVSGYAEMDGIAPGFPRLTKPFRSAELAASVSALMPGGAK